MFYEKSKGKIIVLTTVAMLTAAILLAFNGQVFRGNKGKTKYILIRDAEMMSSGILKPNAAILITDIDKIKENEDLFIGNKTSGHACGYHYNIQFWESADKLVEEFPFNQECEEFIKNDKSIQTKMKGYIKILETKPTHFIYNLKVPVSLDPAQVKKSFDDSNLIIFFLNGLTEHYSSLTFTYMQVTPLKEFKDKTKWDGEKEANANLAIEKMNSIVDEIGKVATITEQSKISFPMQGFGREIEHKAQITLKFKSGTDLTEIKRIIASQNGIIENESNPESYFIQLVDKSSDLEVVKGKLKKIDFITDVFEYPKTK